MRHGSSGRRQRSRGGSNRGNGGGNNRMQVFDSNGPDVRIRGTAHQVVEKYMALAKDANGSGDIVMEQNYLQHAEHYQRIIGSWNDNDARNGTGNKAEKQEDTKENTSNKQSNDDDLSLPSSILGESVETQSKEEMVEAV